MILVTAIAVKAVTWFCIHVVHGWFSAVVLKDAPFNHPLGKRAARTKFIGTAWQFFIHASMVVFEMYVLYDEDWLSHPWQCFYPNPQEFVPKQSLRLLYLTQIAIWVYTCFQHRFNADAHAHKDYFVMYVHHLVTIGLVGLAYVDNNMKVGAIVLFVHDASDIGIDTLKMANYLRLDGRPGLFIVETAYAVTMAMWVYFRLYIFPFFIILQSSLPSLYMGDDWWHPDGTRPLSWRMKQLLGDWTPEFKRFYISGVICNLLLATLFVLHIWWFALLLRILVRLVRTNDPHAAGSAEYEGDSDAEDDDEAEGEGETASKPAVTVKPASTVAATTDKNDDDDDNDDVQRVGLPTRRKLGAKATKTKKNSKTD
jgi:ceramide synthetase